MKRDARLHGLTSDHHHALRLAWDVRHGAQDRAMAIRVAEAFERDLAPHFAAEERLLLPPLAARGAQAIVDRTLTDHAELRALATRAQTEPACLADFAERLTTHVRFEERELFAACERLLTAAELDEVARQVPKRRHDFRQNRA